jgi:hypothetical protein
MSSLPKIRKYDKKRGVMLCPDCKNGGDVWADGYGHIDLPLGFGFLPNDTKFSVEKMRMKGHFGECIKCRSRVFNWISRRKLKEYPGEINQKLRSYRKGNK